MDKLQDKEIVFFGLNAMTIDITNYQILRLIGDL